jgi:ABC-type amino acid transport substrate-binding protein
LLSGILVWLFERGRNADEFGGPPARGIGAGFWWAAVTMTTVGYGDKAPVTVGGRIVALFWMFASLIVISGFTAAIASALTIGGLASPVEGPEDLVHVDVGTVGNSSSAAWLDEQRIRYADYDTVDAALRALVAGRVEAVVYDAPILHHAKSGMKGADIAVLPRTFDEQTYAFALPEASPLREPLNRVLLSRTDGREWKDAVFRYTGERDR